MNIRRLLTLLLVVFFLTSCSRGDDLPYIQLSSPSENGEESQPGSPARLPLRVAVAAVISPGATLEAYEPLLNYLSEQLDRPVQLIQRGTYAEINDLVASGAVDMAFVCGGAYVEGERDFGMEILLAPMIAGDTVYYSYVIVASDSPYISLSELRGKTFAFSDPLSNSGHLALQWQLDQMGETPDTFFEKTIFTYSHDNSIEAVIDHLVDGAAVDSLVYDAMVAQDSSIGARLRIVQRLGPYGIPPVVVHPGIEPELKQMLRDTLLAMHSNPEGAALLAALNIERFVEIDPAAYDSIRTMSQNLRGWDGTP